MKKILCLIAAVCLLMLAGCQNHQAVKQDGITVRNGMVVASETVLPKEIKAEIETELGTICVTLHPDKAPLAVENFVGLAKKGYYDGVVFHRIVSDMMIQGGDPLGTGTGGDSIWNLPFPVEWDDSMNFYSGALAMANAGGKNSSQFFLVDTSTVLNQDFFDHVASQGQKVPESVVKKYVGKAGLWWLEGGYTVFGHVTEGQEIVHQIEYAALENQNSDRPAEPVKIKTVRILE